MLTTLFADTFELLEPVVRSILIPEILVHVAILITVLVLFVVYVTSRDARIAKHLEVLGGPPSFPIVGNLLSVALKAHEDLPKMCLKWGEKYGPCFRVWVANIPYVAVIGCMDAEKVLSSTVHIDKGRDYERFLEAWLGTGLLTARREKWSHRRKLLTPSFHFKILEDFVPVFNENANILTSLLKKQEQQSNTFNISPFISRCTLDVICETAMGEKINAQIGGQEDYVKMVCSMTDIILVKGLNPLYRNQYLWNMTTLGKLEAKYLKRLHKFTDRMIQYRKSERKRAQILSKEETIKSTEEQLEGVKVRHAFLDLLLDLQENEGQLTDAEIREEVDTFMFEGHDTTGANLTWVILMMACHPQYQKLVHDELDSVFGDDMNREITANDVKQLKYLECCIKETLRLYPSVPMFLRRVEQDIVLDERRTVPAGTSVVVAPYLLHRDPVIFPDPERFDPDRFTIENSAGRHPYAYIPFSAGPRNCIGMRFAMLEEKIILAALLRKFRIEAVGSREDVIVLADIIMRPKNGLNVRLISRN